MNRIYYQRTHVNKFPKSELIAVNEYIIAKHKNKQVTISKNQQKKVGPQKVMPPHPGLQTLELSEANLKILYRTCLINDKLEMTCSVQKPIQNGQAQLMKI